MKSIISSGKVNMKQNLLQDELSVCLFRDIKYLVIIWLLLKFTYSFVIKYSLKLITICIRNKIIVDIQFVSLLRLVKLFNCKPSKSIFRTIAICLLTSVIYHTLQAILYSIKQSFFHILIVLSICLLLLLWIIYYRLRITLPMFCSIITILLSPTIHYTIGAILGLLSYKTRVTLRKCFILLAIGLIYYFLQTILSVLFQSSFVLVAIFYLLNISEMIEQKNQRDIFLVESSNNITNYVDDTACIVLNPPYTLQHENKSNGGGAALFTYGSNLLVAQNLLQLQGSSALLGLFNTPPHVLATANESHGNGEVLFEVLNTLSYKLQVRVTFILQIVKVSVIIY